MVVLFKTNTNIIKGNQTILEKKVKSNLLVMMKDLHICTGFQHSMNTRQGQGLLSVHQGVLLNLSLRLYHLS